MPRSCCLLKRAPISKQPDAACASSPRFFRLRLDVLSEPLPYALFRDFPAPSFHFKAGVTRELVVAEMVSVSLQSTVEHSKSSQSSSELELSELNSLSSVSDRICSPLPLPR